MMERPQNPVQIGKEMDLRGLEWVWDFGWLRPQELGRLLWPKVGHATKNAERICRKWEDNGLIIRRNLPNHNGTAIVLSSNGAELLKEIGIDAKTGKDIGFARKKTDEEKREYEDRKKKEKEKKKEKTKDPENKNKKRRKKNNEDIVWKPPATWKHDLLSSGVLSICHEMGHEIFPEMKLRRENPNTNKIPDGIIKWKNPNGGATLRIWLEVEASKKSGTKYGDPLAKAVIDSMNEKGDELSQIRCNYAMIAFNPNQICDRGYSLDHKERIKSKIEKLTKKDIKVSFLELKLTGLGVSGFKIINEKIESNEIARAVALLDKKWEKKLNRYRVKGREMEFCSDIIRGLYKAEYWKENEKWFLEYTDQAEIDERSIDPERTKIEFTTLTELKRQAAKLHLKYEAERAARTSQTA
jgi:hypothetical protein